MCRPPSPSPSALVVLVVGLFLRRARATVIPLLTIPVALAATCVAMWAAGYNLDNLSLMAITIAIGFIVDDAVIIVENVIRRLDDGEAAIPAALASAAQMGFTIVAITAALLAALVPILFMPDITGRYFREFGVTLSAAIIASAVVSLTLTPMLCSRMLRPPPPRRPPHPRIGRLMTFYAGSLDWSLRHPAGDRRWRSSPSPPDRPASISRCRKASCRPRTPASYASARSPSPMSPSPPWRNCNPPPCTRCCRTRRSRASPPISAPTTARR